MIHIVEGAERVDSLTGRERQKFKLKGYGLWFGVTSIEVDLNDDRAGIPAPFVMSYRSVFSLQRHT